MTTPNVSLIDPDVLDWKVAADVSYGSLVNQQTFQHSGLFTYNSLSGSKWQYCAYYNSAKHAIIARRNRTAGTPWEKFDTGYVGTTTDSHRVICMGVSPLDGRIHLAMDCHTSVARYTVTNADAANSPESTDWQTAWQPVISWSSLGNITYPMFVATPGGRLLMSYRVGLPDNGQLFLAEWDGSSWTVLGAVTASDGGTYHSSSGWGSSTSRFFYINGLSYDVNGRLHVTATLREQPAVTAQPDPVDGVPAGGIPNRDTVYFYSDDDGRTWYSILGNLLGTTGTTDIVKASEPGIVIASQYPHYAQQNMESQGVDSQGRVHMFLTYVPGRFTAGWNPPVVTDHYVQRPTYARLIHMWQTTAGVNTWQRVEVKNSGTDVPVGAYGRCQMVILPNDDIIAFYPKLKVLSSTAASGYLDWQYKWTDSRNSFGEVLVDYDADENAVYVMYQENGGNALAVRKFQVS